MSNGNALNALNEAWNLSAIRPLKFVKKIKRKILKLFISSNPDVDFLRLKILKLKCYLKLCGNTKENSNLRFPSSNITALTRRVKTPFLAYLVLLFHIGHMGIDYNILELTSYFTNRIHKNLKRGWFFDVSKLYVSRWKSYYFYFITKIWSRMWHPSDKQFYRKKFDGWDQKGTRLVNWIKILSSLIIVTISWGQQSVTIWVSVNIWFIVNIWLPGGYPSRTWILTFSLGKKGCHYLDKCHYSGTM